MRFVRGDVRDHIASHKNDHGPSYRRYRALQRSRRLKNQLSRDFRYRSIFDFCNSIPQTADIAKLRAIISEAIYALSITEGSEPLGAG